MDYISTTPLYDSNYLAHYGIKGQKWGIRRYQNSDGTLTAEGVKRYGSVKEMKKAAKTEYKTDNALAKAYGNQAAQYAYASKSQDKIVDRAQKRYDKHPTDKNAYKLEIEKRAQGLLKNGKRLSEARAKNHYNYLVETYGKKAIKDIKYAKDGSIDERNYSTGLNILSGILAGTSALLTGFGMGMIFPSNKDIGADTRDKLRRSLYKENK